LASVEEAMRAAEEALNKPSEPAAAGAAAAAKQAKQGAAAGAAAAAAAEEEEPDDASPTADPTKAGAFTRPLLSST
jgi:hypothetical protein